MILSPYHKFCNTASFQILLLILLKRDIISIDLLEILKAVLLMREMPIFNKIREISQEDVVRFHMPGHKGDSGFFGGELLGADITELDGSDNLIAPNGIIQKSQKLFAERINAGHSFYSVNGSSAGIMAVMHAILNDDDKIIMARDCHLSAVSALIVTGAQPVFADVKPDGEHGVTGCVTAGDIKEQIEKYPDAKAVYITYPNYFGLCCDLALIARTVHEAGMPLIVDAAHAAAFAYSNLLPPDPAECGADVWISSLHKTLPAMSQCGVINILRSSRIDPGRIKNSLSLFTTTSPSYILLSSIDYASAYMADVGRAQLTTLNKAATDFCVRCKKYDGLKLPYFNMQRNERIFADDFTKIIMDFSGRGISGFDVKNELRANNIYVELADSRRILLLLSVADTEAQLDYLGVVLDNLPRGKAFPSDFNPYRLSAGECYLTPKNAYHSDKISVPLEYAPGLIAARNVAVYPPGIPAVIAGQEISNAMIEYLSSAMLLGYDIIGLTDGNIDIINTENTGD